MVTIAPEPIDRIAELGAIPSSFRVEGVAVVTPVAGGYAWQEASVAEPWSKDYDARPGHAPADWPRRFDTAGWGLLAARDGGALVGAAVVAAATPGRDMLAGRADLAVLWDIRVAAACRGRGVGGRLFAAAAEWARRRGCTELRAETQDVNVAACRFYERMGCRLVAVDPDAYPDLPGEVQLIWSTPL